MCSRGTDSTQRFLRGTLRPLPRIKSRIFFLSRRGERERDEWGKECRRQTSTLGRRVGMFERPLFLPHKILQGVDVNTLEEKKSGVKSHT